MGGAVSLISSVASVFSGFRSVHNKQQQGPDMAAERRKREEQQLRKEAEDRRRDRDKVLEARDMEQRRKITRKETFGSTLSNGGAGLKDNAKFNEKQLKNTLGE